VPVAKKARKTKRRVAKRKTKRPGLPDPASVVSEATLRSPSGRTYRVLHTTERDPYDPPDKPRGKRR
jgi:hypothetical protein